MPTQPRFGPTDRAYLRESAALGHLEAVVIVSATLSGRGWVYGWRSHGQQGPQLYGDRRQFASGRELYLDESELVDLCEALDIAEANAQAQLARIQAMRANLCPS